MNDEARLAALRAGAAHHAVRCALFTDDANLVINRPFEENASNSWSDCLTGLPNPGRSMIVGHEALGLKMGQPWTMPRYYESFALAELNVERSDGRSLADVKNELYAHVADTLARLIALDVRPLMAIVMAYLWEPTYTITMSANGVPFFTRAIDRLPYIDFPKVPLPIYDLPMTRVSIMVTSTDDARMNDDVNLVMKYAMSCYGLDRTNYPVVIPEYGVLIEHGMVYQLTR
jgi:hypothetical protein